MSRLYFDGNSDARKHNFTARGHEQIRGKITWGHKDTPKTAIKFSVIWSKGATKPDIKIDVPNDVDLMVNDKIRKSKATVIQKPLKQKPELIDRINANVDLPQE